MRKKQQAKRARSKRSPPPTLSSPVLSRKKYENIKDCEQSILKYTEETSCEPCDLDDFRWAVQVDVLFAGVIDIEF